MEGALQSVKSFMTALASHLISLIKDETDSITASINHVMESVTEALLSLKRVSQIISEELPKILSDEQQKKGEKSSEYFQSVDDASAMRSSNCIRVDEHEFPDSKFQDMAKDEAAGEDGAVTQVADVPGAEVVGGEENKF